MAITAANLPGGRPAAATTTTAWVTELLRQLIWKGELAAGQPLLEAELASRFGVSRTPVREAIAALVAEGLVRNTSARTKCVSRPSLQDVLDIYQVRIPLERLAGSLAARHMDQAARAELARRLDLLTKAYDTVEWPHAHEALHMAMAEASGNKRLAELVRVLRAQSEPYVRLAVTIDADFRKQAHLQHQKVVQAVIDGDELLAANRVEEHLRSTIRKVEQLLQNPSAIWNSVTPGPSL
jgi:DNA-binding GntR family transcriptional regulator